LDSLRLEYPEVGPDKLNELATARAAMMRKDSVDEILGRYYPSSAI
jgi:hypothetical protein